MSLRQLYELDRSSPQFPEELYILLHDPQLANIFYLPPPDELSELICYLDNILHDLDSTGPAFRKCLYVLKKICSSRMILPPTYEVSMELSVTSNQAVAYGGFCDVYKGILGPVDVVCVKRLRISSTSDEPAVKRALHTEAVVWKHLDHPNVVPFRGVTLKPLQLVSNWMPCGELRHYINSTPHADLTSLLFDVANGLDYLHSSNVIHGDLKGANILIDEGGNAQLVDFGLATIARDPISIMTATGEQGHTPRYTAPEVLLGSQRQSKESDIFSFGMVIIEVFTGKVPFSPSISAAAVALILKGDRPKRPAHPGFANELWGLTQECWMEERRSRPQISEVLHRLNLLKLGRISPENPIDQARDEIPLACPRTLTQSANFGDILFPPSLPQPPSDFLGRDAILGDVLGYAERIISFILCGPSGIGKTDIALSLLHHPKIVTKFDINRHFLDCALVGGSLDEFLEGISKTIYAPHAKNKAQLLSHFTNSHPRILVLDRVNLILDPQAPGAAEIAGAIEEFGRCDKLCLVVTSRLDIKIPNFRHVTVPALSLEAAQDTFCKHSSLERSAAIDNLLAELDFHPLPIALLGRAVAENGWDEARLLEEWSRGKTSILKTSRSQSLEDDIESMLRTPTIQELGSTARETLEAVAAYPQGVREVELLSTFPGIRGIWDAVNVLCKFSVMYRHEGIIKIHSPFRIHFQRSRRVENPGIKHTRAPSNRVPITLRLLGLLRRPASG